MKKSPEQDRERKLRLVDVTPLRVHRTWYPCALFAVHELDTRRWRRGQAHELGWQQPPWHPRQRLNLRRTHY